jgi:hypothetical protein
MWEEYLRWEVSESNAEVVGILFRSDERLTTFDMGLYIRDWSIAGGLLWSRNSV